MVFSQAESELNDSLAINDKLLNINKIRLGFDVFKPIKSSSDGDNLNYEIVGDLQITENLYLAAEYGLTDRLIEDENINSICKLKMRKTIDMQIKNEKAIDMQIAN